MKPRLSIPALSIILLLFSGVMFPMLISLIDKALRELLADLDPTLLMIASFAWLLVFYYYGIKFSLEYIKDQFEITDAKKLINFSNLGFASIALLFFLSLVSAYWLSNLLWGTFYLLTIGVFYRLSTQILLNEKQ